MRKTALEEKSEALKGPVLNGWKPRMILFLIKTLCFQGILFSAIEKV